MSTTEQRGQKEGFFIEAEPPYAQVGTFDVDRFRMRAKAALRLADLTYEQAGQKMGYEDPVDAKNKVKYMLNKAESPDVIDLMKFCNAVRVRLENLLFGAIDQGQTASDESPS